MICALKGVSDVLLGTYEASDPLIYHTENAASHTAQRITVKIFSPGKHK